MYHFFVEPGQVHDNYVEILGGDVNHMKNVLRMKPGEEITISDGFGHEYSCNVSELTEDSVRAEILERREVSVELPSRLVLFQCLPKGDKMELIVQKADAKKADNKVKRWQAIAESAAKQSGRALIPTVEPVMDFASALKAMKQFDKGLIPYECADEILEDGQTRVSAMDQTRALLSTIERGQTVGILIGPEGGLEKSEVAAAMEAGIHPITLGKRILRTETAGLCILSVLMFQLEV